MRENDLHQVIQMSNNRTLLNLNPEGMFSKFIHFVKYGFFGFLAGGILETLVNAESSVFLLIPFVSH